MSETNNTTHEEKVVKLLRSMLILQATAIGLSLNQSEGMSDSYTTHITNTVKREMKFHGIGTEP